jgi:hypothetical protein
MNTELGRAVFEYLWVEGAYYRRPLFGPARWEMWVGKGRWQPVTSVP